MSIISEYKNGGNNKKINNKNIRYSNYTLSLVQEAYNTGNITDGEMSQIQMKTADALCECINTYTHGESTSVMSETASRLLNSLMFTIDAYLISIGDNGEALAEINSESFKNLYYKGIKQLKLIMCEIASLLVKLRRVRINTPNKLYNSVIDDKIMKFLKTYDIASAAHIGGGFDYPVAVPCTKMSGIYYIKGYLMNLYAESLYCKEFDTYEISGLYKTLCDHYNLPYETADINIYTAVYLNAVFAGYLMKVPGNLHITHNDCEKVQKLFSTLTEYEQSDVIRSAAARVNYGNPDYNEKVLSIWMPQILNSIRHGTLKNCLVSEK